MSSIMALIGSGETLQLFIKPQPSPAPATPSWLPGVAAGVGTLLGATIAGLIGALTARYTSRTQQKITQLTLMHARENTQAEIDHLNVRMFNERFSMASEQLGHREPTVRLAGVYAMAGLADDWVERQQTCIDVLCAYLRLPYPPEPDETSPPPVHLTWQAHKQVRQSIISCIREHLVERAESKWRGRHLDFSGVVFDGGHFMGSHFDGGVINFSNARFINYFSFREAKFTKSVILMAWSTFEGRVGFEKAEFHDCLLAFDHSKFFGGGVNFDNAVVEHSIAAFHDLTFSGGSLDLRHCRFLQWPPKFSPGVDDNPPEGLLLPGGS
ncbi:pentapeptide repeat-containing protein [Streptomyces sp. NPDC060000]|uniref:pentapeptide repeat-containing protein n=1 Tax=Streptomyces sp. NPDC060000 TaxID=3347031 RepID=UPI0036CA6BFE